MNHRLPDGLMHEWLSEVIRRQRGETTGVRALSLALSGHVSACCGATPTETRRGAWKCPECRQQCQIRSWAVAREQASRGGWDTMHVKDARRCAVRTAAGKDQADGADAVEADAVAEGGGDGVRGGDVGCEKGCEDVMYLVNGFVCRTEPVDLLACSACSNETARFYHVGEICPVGPLAYMQLALAKAAADGFDRLFMEDSE